MLGTLLMAVGHLMMVSEHLFLLALLSLVLGAGCIKGNMAVQVGRLYGPDDTRRTRAFGIYLIALNVGAFVAPLICGTLGEKVGFHWGFGAAGIGMLVTWFATLDGILTILAVFVAIRLWAWQAKRGREPGDVNKIITGLLLAVVGFGILTAGTWLSGAHLVALIFPVVFFIFQDLAIPFIDTVTMPAFSRSAPAAVNTTMMGVYYLASAACQFLLGWLGRFYETMTPAQFWLLHTAVAGAGLVFLLVFGRPLARILTPRSAMPETT